MRILKTLTLILLSISGATVKSNNFNGLRDGAGDIELQLSPLEQAWNADFNFGIHSIEDFPVSLNSENSNYGRWKIKGEPNTFVSVYLHQNPNKIWGSQGEFINVFIQVRDVYLLLDQNGESSFSINAYIDRLASEQRAGFYSGHYTLSAEYLDSKLGNNSNAISASILLEIK